MIAYQVIGWYKGTRVHSSTVSDGCVFSCKEFAVAYGKANMTKSRVRGVLNATPSTVDYHLRRYPVNECIVRAFMGMGG